MRKLSNKKIRGICDEIITILEQRSSVNPNFLCHELKGILLKKTRYSFIRNTELKIFIPKFTYQNAAKYANGRCYVDSVYKAWWGRLDNGDDKSYPIETFNFDDRILFMKWLKDQYKESPLKKWFKKVFKLLPVLLLGVTLMASCNDATDKNKCYENVQEAFPTYKIYSSDNRSVEFIAIDDSNNVFLIKTLDNNNVSNIYKFKLNQ
jgi:hypothetical protein